MGMGVSAPGAGDVKILVVGEWCEREGNDPLHDEKLMGMCRKGFEATAVKLWQTLNTRPTVQSVQHAKRWT